MPVRAWVGVAHARERRGGRPGLVGFAVCAGALACGADDPPPAIRVGPVSYADAELGALSPGHRADLAVLAGFGLAVAGNALPRLIEPLAEAAVDSAAVARLLDDVALSRSGLSEEAIAASYRAAPELELTVRHLVLLADGNALDGVATGARARAVIARNRILAGEDFARVAAETSEEPGAASRGGLLSPGRRGDWVAPFWEAAIELRPGEVSEVVRTPYGFHVLLLEARRVLPLEEVRREVAGRLVPGEHAVLAARAWADSVVEGSRRGVGALAEEARRRRLGPTAEERERARATAEAEALVWASALGFRAGAAPDEVGRLALAALASNRQRVALARSAVLRHRDAVRALYPEVPSISSEAVQADSTR